MINRENYEIWFLDYFEGNLSKETASILFEFLNEYPDLKEEFQEFEIISLKPEEIKFNNKSGLKMNLKPENIQGLNEFEILAISKIEQNISFEEEKKLESILRLSPDKRKENRAFQLVKFQPDLNVVFPEKSSLKRGSVIKFPSWAIYISGIAALFLSIIFIKNIVETKVSPGEENSQIAYQNNNHSSKKQAEIFSEPISKGFNGVNNEKYQSIDPHTQNRRNIKKIDQKIPAINDKSGNESIVFDNKKLTKPEEKPIHLVQLKPELIAVSQLVTRKIPEKTIDQRRGNSEIAALTPKEFLIKKVKTQLELNDGNYDKIDPVKVAVASIDKLEFANVSYNEKPHSGKKRFSFSIGGFGIERSWHSN